MHTLRILLSLALILALAATPTRVHAQTQVSETSATHIFNENVTFNAILQSDIAPEMAIIFFHSEQDAHTNVNLAKVTPQGEGGYLLEYIHKISDYRLRPFANIEYRYEITLADGNVYKSPAYLHYYDDNRFEWQSLEEAPFRVHWLAGDISFAQNILDTAQEGLKNLQSILPLPAPAILDIYAYADSGSLQAALSPSSSDWVAGHADPDLEVILVSLPPGPEQRLLMEQRIPHELLHIALYQANEHGYRYIPTWLSEGLASLVELYPNPDYQIVLEDAVQRDSLLPIESLCSTFPRDASNALLSYAQSASFVQYLHATYGSTGLNALIKAYNNGLSCDRGAQVALGLGLRQLERQWQRDALSENVLASALLNLLPWLVLLIAILLGPLLLSLQRRHSRPATQSVA
ncbi:MAG: peptidase MA family metallohydrolase [Chloroflexota bacterium]